MEGGSSNEASPSPCRTPQFPRQESHIVRSQMERSDGCSSLLCAALIFLESTRVPSCCQNLLSRLTRESGFWRSLLAIFDSQGINWRFPVVLRVVSYKEMEKIGAG